MSCNLLKMSPLSPFIYFKIIWTETTKSALGLLLLMLMRLISHTPSKTNAVSSKYLQFISANKFLLIFLIFRFKEIVHQFTWHKKCFLLLVVFLYNGIAFVFANLKTWTPILVVPLWVIWYTRNNRRLLQKFAVVFFRQTLICMLI